MEARLSLYFFFWDRTPMTCLGWLWTHSSPGRTWICSTLALIPCVLGTIILPHQAQLRLWKRWRSHRSIFIPTYLVVFIKCKQLFICQTHFNKVLFLFFFFLRWKMFPLILNVNLPQPEIIWKETHLRNWVDWIGLWACLWGRPLWVSPFPRQEVLNSVKAKPPAACKKASSRDTFLCLWLWMWFECGLDSSLDPQQWWTESLESRSRLTLSPPKLLLVIRMFSSH